MLSGRLVHLIEANSASIVKRVITQIRRDPELAHLSQLPERELQEWGEHMLEKFGDSLGTRTNEELTGYCQSTGQLRFEQGVPLHEAVRALFLLKNKMIDFVLDQAATKTFLRVYEEEELEHRVDRFFDNLVCHMIRGYEDAWRDPAHKAVFAR